MSKLLMIVKADTNDADYVTSENWVTEEDLEVIKKVWKIVKDEVKHKGQGDYNWITGQIASSRNRGPYERYADRLTQEEISFFDDYVPHGEYGVHTVESITVHEIVKTTKL